MAYDAFISYSHAGDGRLAPRLQSGLQRFARPWWRPRVLRVFRDETGLSASPHLWTSIVEALDAAEWFVLLASPESAASEWVGREIEHWVAHRDPERMLLVVTDGTFRWDEASGDVDLASSTAAHPALSGVFAAEPRHIDLTWARADEHLDRRNGRFQDALAELAAPLRGLAKDEIAGEDVRQHRRTMRIARAAVAGLTLLTVLAVVAGVLAIGQRNTARDQRAIAEEQRAIAEEQRAAAESERSRADAEALTATSRSAAANAVAAAPSQLDRSLLLGAAAVMLEDGDASQFGLLSALDAASSLATMRPDLGPVDGSDVSPDGTLAATVALDGTVRLLTLPDLELKVETVLDDAVRPYYLEFVGDTGMLAVHGENAVFLLDSADLSILGDPWTAGSGASAVPDGGVLADVAEDGSVIVIGPVFGRTSTVYDLASGEASATVTAPESCFPGIRGLDVHVATRRIALVCDIGLAVADLDTGEIVASGDSFNSNSPLFRPDGSLLAVTSITASVQFYDAATLDLVDEVTTPGTRPYAMDFTADGAQVAIGTDSGDVRFVSITPNIDFGLLPPGVDPATVDPATLVPAGEPAWVVSPLFDVGGLEGGVFGASFLPGSATPSGGPEISRLVTGGPFGLAVWSPGAGVGWASARFPLDPSRVALVDASSSTVWSSVEAVDDSSGPLGTAPDGRFEVIDLGAVGAPSRELDLEGDDVTLLDVSAGGDLVVATGVLEPDTTTSDAAAGSLPTRFELQLADAGSGEVVQRFDLLRMLDSAPPSPAPIPEGLPFEVGGPVQPTVRTARLSPDETKVLVEIDAVAGVYDVASGDLLGSTTAGLGRAFDWADDSAGIVVGGFFGVVELFGTDFVPVAEADVGDGFTISDVTTAPQLGGVLVTIESGDVLLLDTPSLEPIGEPFSWSGVQLQETEVDAAGTTVAAIDRNGDLRRWRVDDRARLGPPMRMSTNPFGGATFGFDAQGRIFPEVTFTSEVVAMSFETDDLVDAACRLAGRELTAEEWATYVGDREQAFCADRI